MTKSLFSLLFCVCVFLMNSCDQPLDSKHISTSDMDSLLLKGIRETTNLEFEKSYESLSLLLEQASKQKSAKHQVLGNLNMGVLYLRFSNDKKALNYFFESLRISEEASYTEYLNAIYNNIGVVYSENSSYDESLKYYKKARDFSIAQQDSIRIGISLVNVGLNYLHMHQKEKARTQLTEAKVFLEGKHVPNVICELHQGLGQLDLLDGNYESALKEIKRGHAIGVAANFPLFTWESELSQAKVFLKLGELDSAEYYTQHAVNGFNEINNKDREMEAFEVMGQIALDKKEFELAKTYFSRMVSLKDSLLIERKSKWVNESQMNYEFGKINAEIDALETASENERRIWAAGIAITILIIFLVLIIMRTRNRNLRQKNVILEQEKKVDSLVIEKNQAINDKLKQTMLRREEITKSERQRMRDELEHKNRELVSKALHLVNKNEALSSIQTAIAKLKSGTAPEKEGAIKEIETMLRAEKSAEEEWKSFRLHFEEVHPDFFKSLNEQYPELNHNDQRMCAYFKLGLTAKEIAQILNISPDSIRKRKQRLKEKLNFESSRELLTWLQ